jgi:hypothetical protein
VPERVRALCSSAANAANAKAKAKGKGIPQIFKAANNYPLKAQIDQNKSNRKAKQKDCRIGAKANTQHTTQRESTLNNTTKHQNNK